MAGSAFPSGGGRLLETKTQNSTVYLPGTGGGNTLVFQYTVQHSGICVFSCSGGTGYFVPTLNQNSNTIAGGYNNWGSNFDLYVSKQYSYGYVCKAFKVQKGDVISLYMYNQGDASGNKNLSCGLHVIG